MWDMMPRNEKAGRAEWRDPLPAVTCHILLTELQQQKLWDRITAAEAIILDTYGLGREAQLYGVNVLRGHIDPIGRGAKKKGDCNWIARHQAYLMQFLWGALAGKDYQWALHPRAPRKTSLSGKINNLYRKPFREEQETGVPSPPSRFTRTRDGIPFSALNKFMEG